MFFDKQIFEVIPSVKKNSNMVEKIEQIAGEGNEELDMTLPRQVPSYSPDSLPEVPDSPAPSPVTPELALLQGPSSRFDFQIFDFCLYGQVPVSLHSSESDGEGPSTPQPVTPERRASSSSASWPAPALGAVLALWFGSDSRTVYRWFYPMTNHIQVLDLPRRYARSGIPH